MRGGGEFSSVLYLNSECEEKHVRRDHSAVRQSMSYTCVDRSMHLIKQILLQEESVLFRSPFSNWQRRTTRWRTHSTAYFLWEEQREFSVRSYLNSECEAKRSTCSEHIAVLYANQNVIIRHVDRFQESVRSFSHFDNSDSPDDDDGRHTHSTAQ